MTTTMNKQSTNKRGGAVVRGAVATGVASALMLGGFGVFALWSDSQNAGATGQVQTGSLSLDPISGPVVWQLENPQGGGGPVAIDLATYKASPGDVISYTVEAAGTVTGTDITAELRVDLDEVQLDAALSEEDVIITVLGAGGEPLEVVGSATGTTFSQPVTVSIEFSSAMTGGMDLPAAVSVDGLSLVLQQL